MADKVLIVRRGTSRALYIAATVESDGDYLYKGEYYKIVDLNLVPHSDKVEVRIKKVL